jgi:hypothetical protein
MKVDLVPAPRAVLTESDKRLVESKLRELHARDGRVTPESFVELATPEDSPLHRFFEWNDAEAARQHRLHQARQIVRTVVFRAVRVQVEKRVLSLEVTRPLPPATRPFAPADPGITDETPRQSDPAPAPRAPELPAGTTGRRLETLAAEIEKIASELRSISRGVATDVVSLMEVAQSLASKAPWEEVEGVVDCHRWEDLGHLERATWEKLPADWDRGRPLARSDCRPTKSCPSCGRVVPMRISTEDEAIRCPSCGVEVGCLISEKGWSWVGRDCSEDAVYRPSELPMHVLNRCRPCWVAGCSDHLYLEVAPIGGHLQFKHEGVAPTMMDKLSETCSRDIADQNPGGVPLEVVGDALGLTRERVRQIEMMALEKLRRRASENGLNPSLLLDLDRSG